MSPKAATSTLSPAHRALTYRSLPWRGKPGARPLSRSLALALALALAAALSGCGAAPTIRFHTLVAPAATQASAQPSRQEPAPFAIEVLPVGIPAQLDQPQLVVRDGDSGLVLLETERWAASLADEVRNAVSADLTRQLATQDIAGLARPANNAVVKIQIQIRRLDAWVGRQVQLDADWSLSGPSQGAAAPAPLICKGRFALPAPGGYPDLVRAEQRALSALSTQIALDIRAQVADRPARCTASVPNQGPAVAG